MHPSPALRPTPPPLQGEAATKELNDKLQAFTNDAMRFTMDGGISGGWRSVDVTGLSPLQPEAGVCCEPASFTTHAPGVRQPAWRCAWCGWRV